MKRLKSPLQLKSKSGMSLLELMLVTVMLAFIALGTFNTVRGTFRVKRKVDYKTELLQEFRAVISLMDRDLRATFFVTPEDFIWEPRRRQQNEDNGNNDQYSSEQERAFAQKPNPITVFQGTKNNLFFSAKSHQRRSANALENNQHFVLYQMKNDQLIRSESMRAINLEDRENEDVYRSFVLLNKVKDINFTYWNNKSQRWDDKWNSENKEQLNLVPDAVKIEITYSPDVPKELQKEIKDKKIITAIRLPEADFRNIDWAKDQQEKNKQDQKNQTGTGGTGGSGTDGGGDDGDDGGDS